MDTIIDNNQEDLPREKGKERREGEERGEGEEKKGLPDKKTTQHFKMLI